MNIWEVTNRWYRYYFQVYGSNGAQIIPPEDVHIQQAILDNLQPLDSSWDTSVLVRNELNINPLPEVLRGYLNVIENDIVPMYKEINTKTNLRFVYTAMHGVGYAFFARAIELADLRIIPVEEQKRPDPEFPTVKWVVIFPPTICFCTVQPSVLQLFFSCYRDLGCFLQSSFFFRYPNPEEGESALNLAMRTAEKHKISIIIANDPDADRMAVAEKNKKWVPQFFT